MTPDSVQTRIGTLKFLDGVLDLERDGPWKFPEAQAEP